MANPPRPAPKSPANPSAPTGTKDPRPGTDHESTVERALNALSACAETLVQKHPGGPDKQVCLGQLEEAKRLVSELRGSAPAPTPPPPPRATDGAGAGSSKPARGRG